MSVNIACLAQFCDLHSECCERWSYSDQQPQSENENDISAQSLLTSRKVEPSSAGIGDGDCNAKRHRFDSSKSSTYRKNGARFNDTPDEQFGSAPSGAGFMGVDTLLLGSLVVADAMFGQAKTIELARHQDGKLGLGPSAANSKGVESFVVTAFKQGIIDKPMASLWLGNTTQDKFDDWLIAGEITYGGLDTTKCGPVPAYHAISASSDHDNQQGWLVNAEVSVGNATVSIPRLQFDFASELGILADLTYQAKLLAGIGVGHDDLGSLNFDCSVKFNFTVRIDGHEYVLPSEDVVEGAGKECHLAAADGERGQFVLGGIFAKKFCHSLDIGNNRIGFGKSLITSN